MQILRMAIRSLILCSVAAATASAQDASLSAGDLRKSGTVRLEFGCKPELKEDFETAVALLHSFFYEEARRRFDEIAKGDPDCAMAWWGVAMTYFHPLWSPPTPEEMSQGIAAVEKAKAIGGKTDLERGLIQAIDAFFRTQDAPIDPSDPVAQSCHGPRAHGARVEGFRGTLEELRQKFPDNLEVSVFYALVHMASASPTDKTYKRQLEATAILEPLLERYPDHPGIAHYIIHGFDYPTLAARALIAARQYDDVAPWVPHALHMPTHIYTRLGMWEDSIEGNLASVEAARDYATRFHDGATMMDDLHALDYLVFAYLQTARDREAGEVLKHLHQIEKVAPGNEFASAYALGAIPARYALERRHWEEAAALEGVLPEFLALYPFAGAHIEFARAVGAARSGDVGSARLAINRLESLRTRLTEPKFQWWVGQIEIQKLAAEGWLMHGQGDDAEAVALLTQAAELEERSGTHPVTPGQILPAREQLADLLLELKRPSEALTEYERSLEAFPGRFAAHYGAGRAAELAEKREVAREHYQRLVDAAGNGDGRREELKIAEAFVSRR